MSFISRAIFPCKVLDRRGRNLLGLVLLSGFFLNGCASLNYYGQAIGGHVDVLNRRQAIDHIIASSDDAPLKKRLHTVQAARAFASQQLGLPDNASYTHYADLGRDYVVWNVFAAPELALDAVQSCFWLVGCLSYRGFFSQADAEQYAEHLQAQGNDVYVGGVNAYSSLGWFDDPILNTMLKHSDLYLVGLIFHELAHQQIYLKNDSRFNESFASAVEHAGLQYWLAQQSDAAQQQAYATWRQRKATFNAAVLATVTTLKTLYAEALPETEKRRRKQAVLAALRSQFSADDGYGAWLADVNNAKLLTVQTYHDYVPAFLRLLDDNHGDFAAFYRQVASLGQLEQPQREAQLRALSNP